MKPKKQTEWGLKSVYGLVGAVVLGLAAVTGVGAWKMGAFHAAQEESLRVDSAPSMPAVASTPVITAPVASSPVAVVVPPVVAPQESVPVQEEAIASTPVGQEGEGPQVSDSLLDAPVVPEVMDVPAQEEGLEESVAPEVQEENVLAPAPEEDVEDVALTPEAALDALLDRESRAAFAEVSRLVFARNQAYAAAIARARSENNDTVAQALEGEMAQQARAIVNANFPGGSVRYREVARLVREHEELERDIAQRLEE